MSSPVGALVAVTISSADAIANAIVMVNAKKSATILHRGDFDTCRSDVLMVGLLSIDDAAVGPHYEVQCPKALFNRFSQAGARDSSRPLAPLPAVVFFGQRRKVGDQLIDRREAEDLALKLACRPAYCRIVKHPLTRRS
jgi:hypothetical protein